MEIQVFSHIMLYQLERSYHHFKDEFAFMVMVRVQVDLFSGVTSQ